MSAMPLFGQTHGLATLVLMACAAICIHCGRRGCTWPCATLAFCCLAAFPMNLAAYRTFTYSIPLNNIVPGHLCDIVALTAAFALLTGRPLLCELTYCWGLAGTMQGLITPNLPYDFPHPVFFSFFLQHGVIVIAALYLPLALKWKPREGVVWRILFWNQVYFCGALLINWLLGTNFGFLSEKPLQASPLDLLGPWPAYLIWLQVIAAVLMTILLLPFSRSINIWRWQPFRSKSPS